MTQRWIENPEACGLRFVGLSHNVGKAGYAYTHDAVNHTGWFLSDLQDETVSGVVYQVSGRKGRARYVAGYADPWNTDSEGHGPAFLDLSMIHETIRDCSYDPSPGLRDAAQLGDRMAEIFAEKEREYQDNCDRGREARRKALSAREIAEEWATNVRLTFDAFSTRHKSFKRGQIARHLVKRVRENCNELIEAREAFHSALSDKDLPGFWDGYYSI